MSFRRVIHLAVVVVVGAAFWGLGAGSVETAPANSSCLVPVPPAFGTADPFNESVQIDIKPGNRLNNVNPKSNGVIDVAICSETGPGPTGFFAPEDVIVKCGPQSSPSCRNFIPTGKAAEFAAIVAPTPRFGVTGFQPSLESCNGDRDVNGDGLRDLVCKFKKPLTGVTATTTALYLTGHDQDFGGGDWINCSPDGCPSTPPPLPCDATDFLFPGCGE
ncbi:MAG: hypothetical protein ACRDFW_11900 [bacterium]